jgi:RNA polymerase sigma-70 factor (ECF subfamily)
VDLEALRRRDEPAWRELHAREFPVLFRYGVGLGADHDAAEDCANESFARLLQALPTASFADGGELRAWLLVVCRNLVRDHQRRRRAVPLAHAHEQRGDDGVTHSDTRVALHAALATLPAGQRDVVVLRFLLGMSTKEVAGVIGRGIEAVESLQRRALASLRNSVALEGYQP